MQCRKSFIQKEKEYLIIIKYLIENEYFIVADLINLYD